ncbi:MAG TPA: FHA domain-containing protein [Desulfatiglandales bacterium]|nr:FHA domain-containing protein [Desulfatiglandales bacterium]
MPKLRVIKGSYQGKAFDITGNTVFVGRSSRNDIQIKDTAISRKQIKIFLIGGKYFIEDLKSTNGTLINGGLITPGEGFEVGEGDTISMGNTVMQLCELPKTRVLPIRRPVTQQSAFPEKQIEKVSQDRRSRTPRNLELVLKISELLKGSLTIDEFLEKVVDYFFDALPRIDRAAVFLFDSQEKQVKKVIGRSRDNQEGRRVSYSKAVVDRVMSDGKAIRMSNTAYEPDAGLGGDEGAAMIKSVLCVPMIISAQICGAIYVDSHRVPYGFRRDDLLLLNSLSGSVAVAIENAHLRELRLA